jgi:hypothetical protein
LILFPNQIEAIFGEMGYTNPAFILAVYSPGIVGVFMVWRHYGVKGLGSFFGRLTLWRMPFAWWLVLLIGMPAVFYVGAAIKGTHSVAGREYDTRPGTHRREMSLPCSRHLAQE